MKLNNPFTYLWSRMGLIARLRIAFCILFKIPFELDVDKETYKGIQKRVDR